MEQKILEILAARGVKAMATLRSDGWPQATTVSYVSRGLIPYGLVSRTSQKFGNISLDDRVSICIGAETAAPSNILGLSMSARAIESRDEPYRSEMLACLSARRPGYFDPKALDMDSSALIRVLPEAISIIDYAKGLGHTYIVTVGAAQTLELTAVRPDDWGEAPKARHPGASPFDAGARTQ